MNEAEMQADIPIEAEEQWLRSRTEEQLLDNIMTAGAAWSEEQRGMVTAAYNLASSLHKDDKHGDKPYVYHLLRNANRVTNYFHVTDPDVVAAAILHDSVEDHPDDILRVSMFGDGEPPAGMPVPEEPAAKQQLALKQLEVLFSARTAEIVAGMTNPPEDKAVTLTDEEWLAQYADHVTTAIEDPDVFINKVSDWGDNGLFPRNHFGKIKYGMVVPAFEARYQKEDLQQKLDPIAKANVEQMFALGRENLIVGEVGQTAVDNT